MENLLSLGYEHPLIPQAPLSPQGIESLLPFTLPNKAYNTLHKSNYSLQFQSMVWVIYLPTYSYSNLTHM